jgi:hypothetical protein
MRTRSRRRTDQLGNSGHSLFGSTGWLFADLMLAIAMAFLVATTVGTTPPPQKPHHQPAPKHPVAKKPEAALDLNYVNIPMTVDPGGLLSGSPAAIAAVRSKILGNQRLRSRRAGLVLLFGGDPQNSPDSYKQAQELDRAVWKILQGLGQDNFVFQVAVPRDFVNIDTPTTSFQLNIYLFKTS